MRSTLIKTLAFVVALSAPIFAPSVLMEEALAQELDANLELELATALIGTPEEVEANLDALVAANAGLATQILARARTLLPANSNLLTAVNNVQTRRAPTPTPNPTPAVVSGILNNNGGGSFIGIDANGVGAVLPIKNSGELESLTSLIQNTQLQNLIQGFWADINPSGFTACLASATYRINAYGSLTLGLTSGCTN